MSDLTTLDNIAPSRSHVDRRAAAFTLVELLVVVSIIALLIAVLLPSLKRARCQAKRIACMANLRAVAQAGLTYAAEDPQEIAIPVGEGDGDKLRTEPYYAYVGFGGKSGVGLTGNASYSIWGGGNRMGSIHRPLNYVVYKDGFGGGTHGSDGRGGGLQDWRWDSKLSLDLFRCAGDRGFPGYHYQGWRDSGRSGYDYYGTSFAANPLLVGYPGAGRPLESNSMYMRPMSRAPNPTNTVLFWEFAARFASFATNPEEYNQDGCFWPYETGDYTARGHHCKPWHFNASFGDGHASFVKIKGHGMMTRMGGRSDRSMPPSCRGGVCRCIFLRGLGWQLDTLPADLVPTHKRHLSGGGSRFSTTDGRGTEFAIVDR